jgi:universal stress protein family protein
LRLSIGPPKFVAEGVARGVSRRWPDAEQRVVDASPVDAIVNETVRRRADVFVMGWRGHGAVRRLLTGSVRGAWFAEHRVRSSSLNARDATFGTW